MAVNIDSRPQQAVHTVFQHLKSEKRKEFSVQLPVKCAGKHGPVRQGKSVVSAVQTHSARSVVATDSRDPHLPEILAHAAESGGCSRCNKGTSHPFASDDLRKLLIRQLGDEFIHRTAAFPDIIQKQALSEGVRKLGREVLEDSLIVVNGADRHRFIIDKEGAVKAVPVDMLNLILLFILPGSCDRAGRRRNIRRCRPVNISRRIRFLLRERRLHHHTVKRPDRHQRLLHLFDGPVIGNGKSSALRRHTDRVADIFPHIQIVAAFFQNPAADIPGSTLIVIRGKTPDGNPERKKLRLPCFQKVRLHKINQDSGGFAEASLRAARINLHDRSSCSVPDIRHLYVQIDRQPAARLPLMGFHFPGADLKAGIGKAVSERKAHAVPGHALEIAIAHIDIFLIEIQVPRAEILCRRIILQRKGDGIGEVSGRIDSPCQDVHDAQTADHASLPDIQNRIRAELIQERHVDDIAGIQQDCHASEGGAYFPQQVKFQPAELPGALLVAVIPVFPGRPANQNDRDITLFCRLTADRIRHRHLIL